MDDKAFWDYVNSGKDYKEQIDKIFELFELDELQESTIAE